MSTDVDKASVESVVTCACGSKIFLRNYRANGWWKQVIDGDGNVLDTNLDQLRIKDEPKTVMLFKS